MAKIPDKQGIFFELDGVIVPDARLSPDGGIEFLDRALEALTRIDLRQFRLFVATSRQDIAFGDMKSDPAMDPSELAAWTMFTNQLLNLDEVLNK